jgi:hypothetical protein
MAINYSIDTVTHAVDTDHHDSTITPGRHSGARTPASIIAALWRRYIVDEHRCSLPDDGRSWHAIPSADYRGHCHCCAECGSVFEPQAQTSPTGAGS